MRFGLLSPAAPRPGAGAGGGNLGDWIDLNVEAERLGLHSTFLVEHHFTGWGQVSAPLTLLGGLATRTRRLRLGTGVLALPWHNPVLVAEQAATVDVLSGGRLDLGIGRGYRHSEFRGFAIPPAEAAERFDEALTVMTRSWTSPERFSHAGRHWRFDDIVVEPTPVQSPHPPLWMATGSEASVVAAANSGYNLILDQYSSPEQVAGFIATYRAHLRGAADDPMRVAVARHVQLTDSPAEAEGARRQIVAGTRRILEASRDPRRPEDGSHVLRHQRSVADQALCGSAGEIVAGLEALAEVGVGYVLLILALDVTQLRRLAEEVLPRLGHRGAEGDQMSPSATGV